MKNHFKNNSCLATVYKHKTLPVFITEEFSFFRCLSFEEKFYGKTVSELHLGNLRENKGYGRHSGLFPNEKISYWADSKSTALAEIRRHGGNKNYLTFWAYDDASSTLPTLGIDEELVIVDGRDFGFSIILDKVENGFELSDEEKKKILEIKEQNPDCLAYESMAKKGGLNFLFFEKGFRKLSLIECQLYLGENGTRNTKRIVCATTSDYSPILSSYGNYFKPIAKIKDDKEYIESDEYRFREKNLSSSRERISRFYSSMRSKD